MRQGAYEYLIKPFQMDEVILLLKRIHERRDLVSENAALREKITGIARKERIVGDSAAIRAIRDLIDKVAPTDTPVLIQGESGTGKELVAAEIHAGSRRARGPMIILNCAAVPETLLESEMFGYERGAFTGAAQKRPGQFRLADGGTLFMDEIGEMPPGIQAKLLRAIELGEFTPLGSSKSAKVNVRIVAATNRDLEELVRGGRFREDLFYRLQIVPISIPPLRERAEDILLLVDAFLDHFAAKHKRRRLRFSTEALQRVQRFPWPGNVRQLRNVIERLVVTGHDALIDADDLPDFMVGHDRTASTFALRPGMSLAEVEKVLIQQTLRHVTENRESVAKTLGISRRALQYKLKQHGLLD